MKNIINNIKSITYNDKRYPKKLKKLSDPPKKLYYSGNIELINNSKILAIIGCRDYSEYGKKIANKIAYELSKKNIIIISGGAKGIDSFSHIGAIQAKKPTIAVLGNGIDYIYPLENKKLEEKILEFNGLLLSEYCNGTRPNKYSFPARNRIISGICDGVLVVEAKEKSGTFITVDFALDLGKEIYVIPGDITKPNCKGTNELIKQGAKVVTKLDDILEDFTKSFYF